VPAGGLMIGAIAAPVIGGIMGAAGGIQAILIPDPVNGRQIDLPFD